ncbi:MAG: hypothetical protein HDR88_09980 [Bacteroides sp.]|nr:hypothetical protein [Bacteroides sp.]
MTDGEKLEEIRQMTGLQWKELAAKVGLSSGQTFTDIRNGRHGISMKLANRIIEAFPEIRREWLMFESGPMTHKESAGMIALFNSAEEMGANNKGVFESINVGSCFPKAEIAVRNTSDSMIEYPVGCILVMKRVMDMKLLMPGSNYLIETNEFVTIKRLQKGKDDAHIALYSSNCTTYPDGKLVYEPFEIPMDSVKRLFCILGYIYPQANDINKV